MNQSQRLVLSLVCALALVFIPMSYLRAQSTVPQQDQTDRNSINQQSTPDVDQNQDSNLNQEKSTTPDTSDQDQTTREKPSSTEQNTPSQDQNQYQQNQPDTMRGSQSTTRSRTMTQTERSTTQRDQTDQSSQTGTSREGLPATAGELPLIALIGLLSLATAFGTRAVARAKSNR